MENRKHFYLSKGNITGLFIYLTFLLLGSFSLLLLGLVNNTFNENNVFLYSPVAGVLGSSIYYIRKVYRDLFQSVIIENSNDHLKKIATVIYYYTRPLFAAAAALIIVLAIKTGFIFISSNAELDEKNFNYLCIIVSFLAGYQIGKILIKFENADVIKI